MCLKRDIKWFELSEYNYLKWTTKASSKIRQKSGKGHIRHETHLNFPSTGASYCQFMKNFFLYLHYSNNIKAIYSGIILQKHSRWLRGLTRFNAIIDTEYLKKNIFLTLCAEKKNQRLTVDKEVCVPQRIHTLYLMSDWFTKPIQSSKWRYMHKSRCDHSWCSDLLPLKMTFAYVKKIFFFSAPFWNISVLPQLMLK